MKTKTEKEASNEKISYIRASTLVEAAMLHGYEETVSIGEKEIFNIKVKDFTSNIFIDENANFPVVIYRYSKKFFNLFDMNLKLCAGFELDNEGNLIKIYGNGIVAAMGWKKAGLYSNINVNYREFWKKFHRKFN